MATQAIAGYVGRLYESSDAGANYFECGELRTVTIRIKTDMIDTTSHASGGFHDAIPGIQSWDADAELLYVSSDVAQDALDAAIAAKTKLKVRLDPEGTAVGKERFTGDCYVEDIELAEPTTDAAMRTVKIHGVGQLVKSTQ